MSNEQDISDISPQEEAAKQKILAQKKENKVSLSFWICDL